MVFISQIDLFQSLGMLKQSHSIYLKMEGNVRGCLHVKTCIGEFHSRVTLWFHAQFP